MFKHKVKIIKKEIVFDNFFKIEKAQLKFQKFDGKMSSSVNRLNFVRGDSVAALVYNEDSKKIILTNQFRYPTYRKGQKSNGWITELVAGMIDENEKPKKAMKREILEEIGYKTKKIKFISEFFVSPGGSSEKIYLYFAIVRDKDKIQTGGGLEGENENIKILEISIEEVLQEFSSGEFKDAKTIIALDWFRSTFYKQ